MNVCRNHPNKDPSKCRNSRKLH